MRSKGPIFSLLVILTLVVVLTIAGCGPAQTSSAANKGPIIIGYVGTAAGPGTKPCIDAQLMAVEEINAAGGILGRPIKYIVEDNKGETSLSVAGVTRMVMGNKAIFY